ncbi:MAG: hypothetical protein ACRCSC_02705 [Lactococcus garvieae]
MYQVGGNQGNTYEGREGDGFSAIVQTPQVASAKLWLVNKKERQNKEKELTSKIENDKMLGLFDNLKGEIAIPHYAEIQGQIKEFVNKVGNDKLTMKNPFDLTTQAGRDNLATRQALENKIKISKNMQDEYDIFERGEHKTTNDDDILAYRKQFRETKLDDWLSGKVSKVKLRQKNPYESEQSVWSDKTFMDIQNERQQRGIDLVDDEALPLLIKDRVSNPDAKLFYESKYDTLSDKDKKALTDRVVKENAVSPIKVTEIELMARDFLTSTLPRTPFDKSKVASEIAKRVADDIVEVENGMTTIKTKNTSKRFDENVTTKTISSLSSESPDAKRARRAYGISITDIANRTPLAIKAIEDMKKEVKSSIDTGYSKKDDELQKWQIEKAKGEALTGMGGQMQDWIDRVQTVGQTVVSDNAANELIGKNLTLGTEIKEVKVQQGDARVAQNGWIDIKYVDYNDKSTGKPILKNKRIPFDAEHETELANLWQGSASYGRRKGDINTGIVREREKTSTKKDPLKISKPIKSTSDPLGLKK